MITAVVDGPDADNLKALELYATSNIADLSAYQVAIESNANTEFNTTKISLPSVSLTAGSYYWLSNGTVEKFETYFGFAPDASDLNLNVNGDDRYALINVNDETVVDLFGERGVDGTDTDWEYLDGWAAREASYGPSATFDISEWTFSGKNALDNTITNPSVPVRGEAPAGPTIPEIGVCGDESTLISEVQGETATPPELGNYHVVEAVIHQLASGYSGVFIQEEDFDSDSNAATSEGIFVYLGGSYNTTVTDNNLAAGSQIRIVGQVSEYGNITQLSDIQELAVCADSVALPTPAQLTFPLTSLDQLEAVEGMAASITQTMVVSDFFGNGYGWLKYGQFVASSNLHYQPTAVTEPSEASYNAAVEARILDSILIDDGSSWRNPESIPFPNATGFSNSNYFRVGYDLSNLNGAIHGYSSSSTSLPYALIPSVEPIFDSAGNDRTLEPTVDRSGNLVIASMNVLNLFNGVEDPEVNGGETFFPADDTEADKYGYRGAYSEDDYLIQRGKIVEALKAMDADLIGLMEIENDGFGELSSIQALLTALNAEMPTDQQYVFVNPETDSGKIGTDAIAVGLLYRPSVLTAKGDAVILDSSNSPTDEDGNALFLDSKNRPSLIQSFTHKNTDRVFTASINHLKSKGSSCDALNDPNLDDGAGNCNKTRERAVQGLMAFLSNDPTNSGSNRLVVMGDMNAYSKETPIQMFESKGMVNLKATNKATEAHPFSYSYGGFLGSLDYILGSNAMTSDLLSIDAWHINSLEANAFDYDTDLDPYDDNDTYASVDPYYSSDHDPIIASFLLTKTTSVPDTGGDDGDDDKKGGSLGWPMLLLLPLLAIYRKTRVTA
ncbi:hypothetical protein MED297_03055 [Reinekea sp. MED297]|uniref:Endonuclease/exonuclease/phosphatase domain-containing protein n=2 Tax=Reinekea TaxID=230494 RepID=A4BH03_9GAMM|nr:hypothetical protein MED297_03055 [Reinekea sp. MED297] [Reinekea blandensis MED297]